MDQLLEMLAKGDEIDNPMAEITNITPLIKHLFQNPFDPLPVTMAYNEMRRY